MATLWAYSLALLLLSSSIYCEDDTDEALKRMKARHLAQHQQGQEELRPGEMENILEQLASFSGVDSGSLHFEVIGDGEESEEGIGERISDIVKERMKEAKKLEEEEKEKEKEKEYPQPELFKRKPPPPGQQEKLEAPPVPELFEDSNEPPKPELYEEERPPKPELYEKEALGYGPDNGKYNKRGKREGDEATEMSKQEIVDYLEEELRKRDRLMDEFRNVENKCPQYAELSGETERAFAELEKQVAKRDAENKDLRQQLVRLEADKDRLTKQVRNCELDREQWERDEGWWNNEMSRVVLDLKVAGDVIKDDRNDLKACQSKAADSEKEVKEVRLQNFNLEKDSKEAKSQIAALKAESTDLKSQVEQCTQTVQQQSKDISQFKSGNAESDKYPECVSQLHESTHALERCSMTSEHLNFKLSQQEAWKVQVDDEIRSLAEAGGCDQDLQAEHTKCKLVTKDLKERQNALNEAAGDTKKELHECKKSAAETQTELEKAKKSAKCSKVKKQLKECQAAEKPGCLSASRMCPEYERQVHECHEELEKMKNDPAAGLQEIHKLKFKIFEMEKAHNDSLRDVGLLNGTNKEINDQLDYCTKMVTQASEDLAAAKTGDVDDDKCVDCMSKLYEASHSLDRCSMANYYLNLKVDAQNKWKEEADAEILTLAEMGGCVPDLQAEYVKCKKANKDMQDSHDYIAKSMSEKTQELSTCTKNTEECTKELETAKKGQQCPKVRKQLKECQKLQESDSTQQELKTTKEELKQTKKDLKGAKDELRKAVSSEKEADSTEKKKDGATTTVNDMTFKGACEDNLAICAKKAGDCIKMKQGFKVSRHFLKKDLEIAHDNATMLHERLQEVSKERDACFGQQGAPADGADTKTTLETSGDCTTDLETATDAHTNCRMSLSNLKSNHESLKNQHNDLETLHVKWENHCNEVFTNLTTCEQERAQAVWLKNGMDMIINKQEGTKTDEQEKYDKIARRAKRAEIFFRNYFYPLLAAFILLLAYNFYVFLCWRWDVYQEKMAVQRQLAKEKKEASRPGKGRKLKTR